MRLFIAFPTMILAGACGPLGEPPVVGELDQAQVAPAAPDCDDTFVNQVLEDATPDKKGIEVKCSLTLPAGAVVSKRLYLSGSDASGVTIDCQGGAIDHRKGGKGEINNRKDSILIRSLRSGSAPDYVFDRPTDITVKNCTIYGAIRVMGMAHNGQGIAGDTREVIRESSHRAGHTARARQAAPTRLTFDAIKVIADHRTPFYLAPGVTHTALKNSELAGRAVAAAVYLDAESAFNTLRDNKIHTERYSEHWYKPERELISIDGSSYNTIINNWLAALRSGGIYVYRNCGEKGVTRHAWPMHNTIVNNVFYYKKYSGLSPSVFLGAKDGFGEDFFSWHCDDDDGVPFGSGASDADYARNNVVMQNQIFDRPLSYGYDDLAVSIRQQGSKNKPNYIGHNQVVTAKIERQAGCYVPDGYLTDFIADGKTIDLYRNASGEPECRGYRQRCDDGKLVAISSSSCSINVVNRGCGRTGSNAGCSLTASCPAGRRVIAARAACNLEWGSVSSNELAAVPIDKIRVVKRSDHTAGSTCQLHQTAITSGTRALSGIPAGNSVNARCAEHDSNGGDCEIRVQLYCHGALRSSLTSPATTSSVLAP